MHEPDPGPEPIAIHRASDRRALPLTLADRQLSEQAAGMPEPIESTLE